MGQPKSYGRKVVKEMNRLGIMVDISHVTDEVINQVLDMTDVPVVQHILHADISKGWKEIWETMKSEDLKTMVV